MNQAAVRTVRVPLSDLRPGLSLLLIRNSASAPFVPVSAVGSGAALCGFEVRTSEEIGIGATWLSRQELHNRLPAPSVAAALVPGDPSFYFSRLVRAGLCRSPLVAQKFTITPTQKGTIRVLHDPQHDRILQLIKQHRREALRSFA
jgi:hypothetical protein